MNHYLMRPRDREELQHVRRREAIVSRTIETLRAETSPGELARLPARAIKNRVGVALIKTADAIAPTMRKTEHQKFVREIVRAMIGGESYAND